MKHFLKELMMGLVGIPATAFGVLLIGVFFQLGVEEATGWWQAIVSLALALMVTIVVSALIAWVVNRTLTTASRGWLGLFSGKTPKAFGPRQGNGPRLAANLILVAITLPLGVIFFRYGVKQDQESVAIMGLFLAGSGVLFGLGSAVPRVYFAKIARRRRGVEDVDAESLTFFFVAAMVGVGLSLAVSFSRVDTSGKIRTLKLGRSYQVCAVGAKEDPSKDCSRNARLMLPATSVAQQMLVETQGSGSSFAGCVVRVWQGETMIEPMTWLEQRRVAKRLQIKFFEKKGDKTIRRILFRTKPGLPQDLRVTSKNPKKTCFLRLTLREYATRGAR